MNASLRLLGVHFNSKLCPESVGTVVDQILFGAWTQDESALLAVSKEQELRAKLS